MLFGAKVAAARAAARLSRFTRTGGGTTLPGRLLLALDSDAIVRLSGRLERGSVVVSATNGKTTTARMLAGMLAPPFRLSHNRAGANLASGVASALLERDGADAGLFEVDEAALPHVARELAPTVMVLGNLFRDQLDRYGELEAIAERWNDLTATLGSDRVLVRNVDDPLVASLDPGAARVIGFGIDDPAAGLAGMEHASDSKWCAACGQRLDYAAVYLGHLGDVELPQLRHPPTAARGGGQGGRDRGPRGLPLPAGHPTGDRAGAVARARPLQRLQRGGCSRSRVCNRCGVTGADRDRVWSGSIPPSGGSSGFTWTVAMRCWSWSRIRQGRTRWCAR